METLADLETWLARHGIKTGQWDRGDAKSVVDLWAELQSGDSRLQDAPPRRLVELVEVIIRRDDRLLVEAAQDLTGGRRRKRDRPPSEKMRPGESAIQAVRRCLQEELGVRPEQVTVLPATHRRRTNQAPSPSYPGLPTHYVIHQIEAAVDGLPDGPFTTGEAAAGPGEPVRRHHWRWRSV